MSITGPKRTINVTRTYLWKEYVENKKSAHQIAKQLGCGETVINNRLHEFKIPIRSRKESLKGKFFSLEHREKLSAAHKKLSKWDGSKNPNWKGGISVTTKRLRTVLNYINFRRRVIRFHGKICAKCNKRLDCICPTCGSKPRTHVHHIKPFSSHTSERLNLSNVIVLCESCHKKHHSKKRP